MHICVTSKTSIVTIKKADNTHNNNSEFEFFKQQKKPKK